MNTVPTLTRPVQTRRVSLNTPSGVWRFPVANGKAATISARLVDGAWAAGTLSVQWWAGNVGPFAFASGAKTIAAGGGAVVASTTDMAGATEIEIAWLAAAVTGTVDLVVAADTDVATAAVAAGSGASPGGVGGIIPGGTDGGEGAGGVIT